MDGRFVVFDVETPNSCNDAMSAIGITVIDGRDIAEELYYLVNPETYFDYFNVELTGITPEMVRHERTFPELWEEIGSIMESGLLIAHNAPFDMSVLAKCLRRYDIPWKAEAKYACTCSMGRKCYPELSNHRLNTLCAYLDIELDHHNAGSDSRAAAELLLDYMCRGINVRNFVRGYDFCACRSTGKKG